MYEPAQELDFMDLLFFSPESNLSFNIIMGFDLAANAT